MTIKKGDIFVTSWGYDQTNYDYIIVISVSPTGKTVKARRTSHEDVEHYTTSDAQKPINRPFGDTFTMRVRPNDTLVGSYPFLGTGVGSKRLDYFRKVEPSDVFYETNPMFGH